MGQIVETELKDMFDRFWSAYPKKVAKANALDCWFRKTSKFRKHVPAIDEQFMSTLLASVEAHIKLDSWQKDNGQFIPNPASYLNGWRWEDDLEIKIPQKQTINKCCCYRCGTGVRESDGRIGVVWYERLPWCGRGCYQKWINEGRPKY